MDGEMYLLHHQLSLVHRGRPWEGATMWKIDVYIYIIVILYICICVFFSLFSSSFFLATCRSLICCQSRRSVSSRWEPRVILGLACVASYAQVSSLYIVNSSITLYICEIFSSDLPRLEVSASIGFFRLDPGIFFFPRL